MIKKVIILSLNKIHLIRQLAFDVLLQSSEQERPQHFVQTTNDQNRFFLVQFDLKKEKEV